MNRDKFLCYLLVGCFSIIAASCKQSSSKKEHNALENKDIYVVDVDNTEKEEIQLSEYFNAPKTIILETTEKCLIGYIDGMQVTNEYIFILDESRSKGVFVFDKEGKFIRKIGSRGKGPGEYRRITDFTLDTLNKEIYLMDEPRSTIHKYNYKTGFFINSLSVKSEVIYSRHIQYWKGKLYTDMIYYRKDQKDKYVIQELDKNTGEQVKTWLDGDAYNKGFHMDWSKDESFFYNRVYGEPKYFQMLIDTILYLETEGLYPYLVVKDSDWVSHEDIKKYKESSEIMGMVISKIYEAKKPHNISNYIECGDLIYFNYWKYNQSIDVIYHKRDKRYRIADRIINNFVMKNSSLGKLGCADKDGIYEYMTGYSLKMFLEICKGNSINTSLDKYNELKNLEEDANPIIFYYEKK